MTTLAETTPCDSATLTANKRKAALPTLLERAESLHYFAIEGPKLSTFDRGLYRILKWFTPLEECIAEVIALNNLPVAKVVKILTYWVKIHNYLAKTWPKDTFEVLYGFQSDITETIPVVSRINCQLPNASNLDPEWQHLVGYMANKGYKFEASAVDSISSGKRRNEFGNEAGRLKRRRNCFICAGSHVVKNCPEPRNEAVIGQNWREYMEGREEARVY